jgi:hypothetical protein
MLDNGFPPQASLSSFPYFIWTCLTHQTTTQTTTPSKQKKRGASSRARQNKSPRVKMSTQKDLNTQNSTLHIRGSDSLTWNALAEAIPRFGNISARDNKVHNVTQSTNLGTVLTSSASIDSFYALAITATSHITQFSSWAAVFDQYKINEVEVWFVPAPTTNTITNCGLSSMYTVIDYDDALTPSATTQLLQYENLMVSPVINGHYRKWRPHIAVAAYSGAFTSFKNEASDWIDVASNSVQHYGIKAGISAAANSATTVNLNLFLRIWVQFRNVF